MSGVTHVRVCLPACLPACLSACLCLCVSVSLCLFYGLDLDSLSHPPLPLSPVCSLLPALLLSGNSTIQLALAPMLGFVMNFVPHPVISGFTVPPPPLPSLATPCDFRGGRESGGEQEEEEEEEEEEEDTLRYALALDTPPSILRLTP